MSQQPGRRAEAEAAYREAIAAGDERARNDLGLLLAEQPGQTARAGVAAGKPSCR